MTDVFISYKSEDREKVAPVGRALEAEGLTVWWDSRLQAGQDYQDIIESNLREAMLVVVIWTPRSVKSRWVRSEATVADRHGALLPVVLEPCEPPLAFELVQTADLTRWTGDRNDPRWQRFIEDIRARLKQRRAQGAADSPPPQISPVEVETLFWSTIKDSVDVADFRSYLDQFPRGHFAALATRRVNELSTRRRSRFGRKAVTGVLVIAALAVAVALWSLRVDDRRRTPVPAPTTSATPEPSPQVKPRPATAGAGSPVESGTTRPVPPTSGPQTAPAASGPQTPPPTSGPQTAPAASGPQTPPPPAASVDATAAMQWIESRCGSRVELVVYGNPGGNADFIARVFAAAIGAAGVGPAPLVTNRPGLFVTDSRFSVAKFDEWRRTYGAGEGCLLAVVPDYAREQFPRPRFDASGRGSSYGVVLPRGSLSEASQRWNALFAKAEKDPNFAREISKHGVQLDLVELQ